MWNKNKSLMLTLIITGVLMFLLTVLVFFMPWILQFYIEVMKRTFAPKTAMLVVFYCLVPFGYAVLGILMKLLLNLKKENIFIRQNVNLLRFLSWFMSGAAVISVIGGFWYLPFLIVGAVFSFMFMILRVVKSAFAYGSDLKDDNDLTI